MIDAEGTPVLFQLLAARTAIEVSVGIVREVAAGEGPVVALGLVDHRDVRLDTLVVDQPVPETEVRAWLDATTSHARWVLDGTFDAQRDLLWSRAQWAVWLDLPWTTTVLSVVRRFGCRGGRIDLP